MIRLNWKLKSPTNIIINGRTNEEYHLNDIHDCIKLLNKLNNYTVQQTNYEEIIKSLEWHNQQLQQENKTLQRALTNGALFTRR